MPMTTSTAPITIQGINVTCSFLSLAQCQSKLLARVGDHRTPVFATVCGGVDAVLGAERPLGPNELRHVNTACADDLNRTCEDVNRPVSGFYPDGAIGDGGKITHPKV